MQYKWESYEVRITVSNTDINMMQKLKELWGGSYRIVKRKRIQWRTCYHYCATSKQAFNMLKSILPFLITKKHQAELAYFLQRRITNGLGTHNRWRKMSDNERTVRHQAYIQMKQINSHKITEGKYE